MDALIGLSGVVLGWGLGAGTQIWRDRRQAKIALTLIHNEILGNIAQLDLALTSGADGAPPRPSHWYKRWKLSRTAWEQQGAVGMVLLDGNDAWKIHGAYHALDAADLLFDEAREGVVALGQAVGDLSSPDIAKRNPEAFEMFTRLDADSRRKLQVQLEALHDAHDVLDRHLRLRKHATQRVADGVAEPPDLARPNLS